MAANTSPIFIGTPNTGIYAGITAANTATDGTGTVYTVFTAGANGSYVRRLLVKALGSNVATVMRVFVNNGSTQGTASNNVLIREIPMTSSSASNSAAIGPDYEEVLNLVLKGGFVINVCIGTAVSGGYSVMAEGGDF